VTLKRSLAGGLCLAVSPMLLNVVSLPAMAYLIRQLGPVQYGQWIGASALVACVALLSSLGLRGAFIRQLASTDTDTSTALANQLGLRLVLSVAASAIALMAASVLGYPLIVLACVAICSIAMMITSMAVTLLDVLQASHRSASISAMTFISGLSLTIASVATAFAGGGPIWIAASYCVGPVVLLALALRAVKPVCSVRLRFSGSAMTALLSQSRGFTGQQLLNSAPAHAEAILLPQLIGLTNFGFYSAGTLLPSRLSVLPDSVCTATYPLLCERFKEDRKQGVQLAIQAGGIVTAGAFFIAVIGAVMSGSIARVLFPAQPDLCQFVLLTTIWALPLSAMDASLGYALNAAGADRAQARASLPAALCNVTVIILLMSQLGVVGACIAMPLRYFVRIIMLGTCCLHLRRANAFNNDGLLSPATAT
jgi:O-antigen/teichoic acid export membrane protein